MCETLVQSLEDFFSSSAFSSCGGIAFSFTGQLLDTQSQVNAGESSDYDCFL